MRYTLSVLTAVCLLALGQPAWSNSVDRELLQRARMAASALPDTVRASAALLLRELQTQHLTPKPQRPLPLARHVAAIAQLLQDHYRSTLNSRALAQPLVATHWLKPEPADMYARPGMLLDPTMVVRWSHALQLA